MFDRLARRLARHGSRILGPIECLVTARKTLSGAPIFITGPARSGTTLVYQTLVYELNGGSVREIVARFPYSPVLVSALVNPLFRSADSKPNFESEYGRGAGLSGIVQGHEIWSRWFPWDAREGALSVKQQYSLRDTIAGLEHATGTPLILKWPGFACYLDDLCKTFPKAFFIFVDRETEALIRSIGNGRIRLQGSMEKPISRSPGGGHLNGSDRGFEGIINYVSTVRKRISSFMQEIHEEQYVIVRYDEFCIDPRCFVAGIADKYENWSGRSLKQHGVIPRHFEISKGSALPKEYEEAIRGLRLSQLQ